MSMRTERLLPQTMAESFLRSVVKQNPFALMQPERDSLLNDNCVDIQLT